MNTTTNVSLGPGQLLAVPGSPFLLNAQQWTTNNNFALRISGTNDQAAQFIASIVPAFTDLRNAAITWRSQTFTNVINTANAIYDYGTTTLIINYTKLLTIVDAMQSGKATSADLQLFDGIMQECIQHTDHIIDATSSIVTDISTFTSAIQLTQEEFQRLKGSDGSISFPFPGGGLPSPGDTSFMVAIEQITQTIVQLSLVVSTINHSPLHVMEHMEGAWRAIKSDLEYIKQTINTDVSTILPILTQLAIEQAMNEWKSVALESQNFVNLVN